MPSIVQQGESERLFAYFIEEDGIQYPNLR